MPTVFLPANQTSPTATFIILHLWPARKGKRRGKDGKRGIEGKKGEGKQGGREELGQNGDMSTGKKIGMGESCQRVREGK